MPTISIEIPENFFTPEELAKLRLLFGATDEAAFAEVIQKIVLASLSEYKEMFLGMGLSSRADEIRQHRLFYLIKYFYEDTLPSEAQISSMFQLTQTRSRSLLQYTVTRFHYNLEQQTKNTLRNVVQSATHNQDRGEYHVLIESDNVLEKLNLIIGTKAPNLGGVRRVTGMSRIFRISVDSYRVLCTELDLPFPNP